jgi:hypothetical protein
MNHVDRAFSFTRMDSKDELMDAMFNHKWPICCSFYHEKLLYLSDGECEDMLEYAVVAIDKTDGRFGVHGCEVGRIKPASMQPAETPKSIRWSIRILNIKITSQFGLPPFSLLL